MHPGRGGAEARKPGQEIWPVLLKVLKQIEQFSIVTMGHCVLWILAWSLAVLAHGDAAGMCVSTAQIAHDDDVNGRRGVGGAEGRREPRKLRVFQWRDVRG